MTAANPSLPPHGKPARWHRKPKISRATLAPPADIAEASPLDIVNWLLARYCAVVEAEDAKGEAADSKRIDATLKAAATLTRGLMPFFHRRLKPSDQAPGEYSHEDALAVLDDADDDDWDPKTRTFRSLHEALARA
jgi:hypothetical protein